MSGHFVAPAVAGSIATALILLVGGEIVNIG
jgi:hypothetical protein